MSWKIEASKEFIKNKEKLGDPKEVKKFLDELEKELRENPDKTIKMLEREPMIARIEKIRLKRIRIGRYRVFYYIDYKNHKIKLVNIRLRKETKKTYRL